MIIDFQKAIAKLRGGKREMSDSMLEQSTRILLDQIILMLMRGNLKAGDQLPNTTELKNLTKLSEEQLASATKALIALGFVEYRNGANAVVQTLPETALNPLLFGLVLEKASREELYELRLVLDLGALELVISKVTVDDLQELENQLRKYQARMVEGDLESLPRLDEQFHLRILEMSKNASLIKIGKTVMKLFSLPLEKASREIGPEQILQNHRLLYEAIAAKDLSKARNLLRQAFLKTMEYF